MRILLADDHAIMRSGLRRIIMDAFEDAEVGEAGKSDELLKLVAEKHWSILILDIALADRNSLELVPEVRQLRPHLPILALSMYSERQFVVHALRVGVSGYVTKDRAPEELLRAIHTILEGERYLSEDVARKLADHIAVGGDSGGEPHEQLSPREYEVFVCLAEGLMGAEIARRLDISVKTVSTYRSRILTKLGIGSNAQLMRYALERGLVK
ncbi:MAG: response regulator transcription factor [Planctomycetota bacterium]|nr:response regulator transcription factor [Planctomycetota bacterium]